MKKQSSPTWVLLNRLYAYTKPYRRLLFFALALSILLASLSPVRPYLIMLSVDKYIGNQWWKGLLIISVVHLGILALETFIRFIFLHRINWLGQSVVNDLRKAVFKKLIYQDVSYFDKSPIGTLTTRTINDAETLNDLFSEGFISIVADLLTIVAIIAVMLSSDWRLTLVCLAPMPLLIVATYFFKESIKKSFHAVRDAVARLNAFVQEHITGMYIVQAFGAEKRTMAAFKEINKHHRQANVRAIMAYSIFFPLVEIILALAISLLVWRSASSMLGGGVTPGKIIAFILYLNLLFRPLRMLADKFNLVQMGMVAAQRIFVVLDEPVAFEDSGTVTKEKLDGDIAFQNVHFSYNAQQEVLKGISFHVAPSKMLAIVGSTGAGKTSIISLLNRQYEISAGKILLDGVDIRSYSLENLRSHIGIVLQDVFLFSGSILENITLKNPDISRSRVVEVCKILDIHSFIESLPAGYDFKVMERGNSLSQGQKQLLSFARVLLYEPSILVLDEATSSVDSETEQLIQRAIDKLTLGRTSIVIAHRLSTIRKAHEILVLHKGAIVERGSHEALMQDQGAYFKMQQSTALQA